MSRLTIGTTCWKEADIISTTALGTLLSGYLICKSGGVAWLIAPQSYAVSRTWYCRDDAAISSQTITGCSGWFVPTCTQFQNPGYTCKTYWDPTPGGVNYWTSTEISANYAVSSYLNGNTGNFNPNNPRSKNCIFTIRAFRCVTY